jgi:hypothetical protein
MKEKIILPEGCYYVENDQDEKNILKFHLGHEQVNISDPQHNINMTYPQIIVVIKSHFNYKLNIEIKRIFFKQ